MSAGVLEMAKRGPGRPKNGKPKKTESVRVRADLAQMIAAVAEAKRQREADMLDALVRPVVAAEFARLYPVIRQMHAESVTAAADLGEAPPPPLPEVLTADPLNPTRTISLEELHARGEVKPKKK